MAEKVAPQPAPITNLPQAPAHEAVNAAHQPPSAPQVDRLAAAATDMAGAGASAAPPSKEEEAKTRADEARIIDDAKHVVENSFVWLNEKAQERLDKLREHLHKVDDPPFAERLIKAALNIALSSGAAGAGELIAGKLFHEIGEEMEPLKEFVKAMFEQGIDEGVEAGEHKISGHGSDAIGAFIDSQKEAVEAAHAGNQTHWVDVGRHQLRTGAQAKAMRGACDRSNMKLAAERQYAATRDAWIGYLAQSKLGSVERSIDHGAGPVRTKVTDMSSRDNASDVLPAAYGLAPGVLTVVADLPNIDLERRSMDGATRVRIAFLNGVNATIRDQYAGQPLSAMKIPRHVIAKAGAFDFTINVDEAGNVGTLTGPQTWLQSRAFVGEARNINRSEDDRERAGVRLLLEELIPDEIKGKL